MVGWGLTGEGEGCFASPAFPDPVTSHAAPRRGNNQRGRGCREFLRRLLLQGLFSRAARARCGHSVMACRVALPLGRSMILSAPVELIKSFVVQASAVTEGPTARTHARTRTHQGVYATRPLRELVQQHVPCTMADAAECVQRLAAEVPRLVNQAAALAPTDGTWTPSAAAVLDKVIGGGERGANCEEGARVAGRSGHALRSHTCPM